MLRFLCNILFHALICCKLIRVDGSQTYYVKVATARDQLREADIISSRRVDALLQCSHECLKDRSCSSLNYRSSTKRQVNCQLSNKTQHELSSTKGHWTLYQNIQTLKIGNIDDETIIKKGTNCADLYASGWKNDGIYTIDPDGQGLFQVRCDMSSGGWTVIQRRIDGSVDFYLGWSQYKAGFGDLNGEFWLGLDKIHRLTQSGLKVLRIDLMDFSNAQVYAEYTTFEIADASSRYRLNVAGFSGNAGDSLNYHNGHQFSTKDNDITSSKCAVARKGAWWYHGCAWSNLNGQYLGANQDQWHGIQWRFWKNTNECMKKADMKLRPRSS